MKTHYERNVAAFGSAKSVARLPFYQQLWLHIPWVAYVRPGTRCDGVRYGEVPLKALYSHGPGDSIPPTGTEKYRCRNNGHWRYKATETSWAKSGTYCTHHLSSQIDREIPRLKRWVRKSTSMDRVMIKARTHEPEWRD